MKLEVGMYVRTNYGLIGKIIKIYKHISGFYKYRIDVPDKYEEEDYIDLLEIQIIKKSYKPIGLIEVGDYVNGKLVTDIHGERIYTFNSYSDDISNKKGFSYILSDYIESIVTKEQFESISYKIGEE